MLFTILCRKGPQITVTSFIERTGEVFVVVVGQITLTKKNSMNAIKRKSLFLFLKSHLPPAPISISDFYSQSVAFHSLNTSLHTK